MCWSGYSDISSNLDNQILTFLPGLLATGGGGGIGSEADVLIARIDALVEKVVQSPAFSFISFTTFSFKIATSV